MSVNAVNKALSYTLSRNLSQATKAVGDSLYRLSSGNRLVRASDEPQTAQFLQRINSQMRGMQQALKNVNQSKGLTLAADGALASMLTQAFQLREISEQANNSGLSSTERDALKEEADEIIASMKLIADETTFDGRNLLQGSLGSLIVQAGPNVGDSFSFEIGDARTTTLGELAIYSGAQGAITSDLGSATLYLNGVLIAGTGSDAQSTLGGSYSARAIVDAINAKTLETNVEAEAVATVRTIETDFAGVSEYSGTFGADEFQINGVSIDGAFADESDFVTEINNNASSTGVRASLSGTDIILTAEDGRNIQVTYTNATTNNAYDTFDLTTNVDSAIFSDVATLSSSGSDRAYVGAVRIHSSEAIQVSGTSASLSLGLASGTQAITSGTAVEYIDLSTQDSANEALKVLDATIVEISSLRAEIGAVHNRLDSSASNLLSAFEVASETKEAVGGTDFAIETANLVMAQLLQDSTIASLTQANVSQQRVLELLASV